MKIIPCPEECGGAAAVDDEGEWSCYGKCGQYGILPPAGYEELLL